MEIACLHWKQMQSMFICFSNEEISQKKKKKILIETTWHILHSNDGNKTKSDRKNSTEIER